VHVGAIRIGQQYQVRNLLRNSILLIALTLTGCSTEAAVCPFHLSRRSCWWQAGSCSCFRISSSCRRDLEKNKRQQGFRSSWCQGLLKTIFLCKYKPSGFICKYTFHLVYQVMVATVRCEEIAGGKLKCFTSDKVLYWIYFLIQIIYNCNFIKLKFISYRNGWKWRKLFELDQNQGLEKLSVLFWKTIFQSKYTSWCQFYMMMCSHYKICVIFNVNLHCVLFEDSSILILLPSVDQLTTCLSVSKRRVETLNYDQLIVILWFAK
jgi:hypothetical protein